MDIKNVSVFGTGVLGSQIAFQCAYHGFNVTVYDLSDEHLEKAKGKFKKLAENFKADLNASQEDLDAAFDRISYSTSMEEAVKEADLAIEAVPESVPIKTEFYTNLGKLAPEKTIFASNSSTLLPSQFAKATGRPARFLALHFANNIWKQNTAEVMGHPDTDPKIFDQVASFAKDIGMVVIPVKKEQPGYVLNSLLVPLLNAGLFLYTNKVAEPEVIDKTWMIATGAPMGPFGIFDVVGLNTAYNITKANPDPKAQKAAVLLKEEYIDKNKLGVASGEGFYTYPNPKYNDPDFLK